MATVAFRIEPNPDWDGGLAVNLYVNGQRLQDLAGRVERPHAEREGSPELAGSYAGLDPRFLEPGCRHFLGEPVETWFDDGDTVLLGCTCGEPGCWPLTARVDVHEETVTWRGFRTGHRGWDLDPLGPFVFDRAQYETALANPERPDADPGPYRST